MRRHILGQVAGLGRDTVTGVLGASGRMLGDWSADSRIDSSLRIELRELFQPLRQPRTQRLAPGRPLPVALNDTRLPASGNKTLGAKDVRDPLRCPTPYLNPGGGTKGALRVPRNGSSSICGTRRGLMPSDTPASCLPPARTRNR